MEKKAKVFMRVCGKYSDLVWGWVENGGIGEGFTQEAEFEAKS